MFNKVSISIIILSFISFICGVALRLIAYYIKNFSNFYTDKINMILPQSQCGKCGYSGCRPYAEAIIKNKEKINKCIPGGKNIELQLSEILNVEDESYYLNHIKKYKNKYQVAFIDEKNCIGCTKCNKVCPVDAIVGSKKTIHTVIRDFCTGCELCLPVCPTNCISLFEKDSKN